MRTFDFCNLIEIFRHCEINFATFHTLQVIFIYFTVSSTFSVKAIKKIMSNLRKQYFLSRFLFIITSPGFFCRGRVAQTYSKYIFLTKNTHEHNLKFVISYSINV